jgi:hypothetical protein
MSNMLSCEQIKLMLDAFHDGELNESEHAEVERHLAGCASCQSDRAAIAAVAASLKSLPTLSPKMDVAANIEHLIATRTKPAQTLVPKPIMWSAVGIAAAAALVLIVGKSGNGLQPADLAVNPPAPHHDTAPTKEIAAVPDKKTIDHKLIPAPKTVNELAVKPAPQHVDRKESAPSPAPQLIAQRPVAPPVAASIGTTSATNQVQPIVTAHDTNQVVVASRPNDQGGTISANNSLVAVYDAEQHNAVTEELGITTNEDGLYAIKL